MKKIHTVTDAYSIYSEICGGANAIESMIIARESGITELVEKLIDAGLTKEQILGAVKATERKETRGRKQDEVDNPLFEKFQEYTLGDLDSKEAKKLDDAIVGVCRSFSNNEGQKRAGLSPSKLKRVMTFSVITIKAISSLLNVGDRHARRYMQGVKLLITLLSDNRKNLKSCKDESIKINTGD